MKDVNLRLPMPFVVGRIRFKAIWILLRPFAEIPSGLTSIWDCEFPPATEFDWKQDLLEQPGDDLVLPSLWVLDHNRIVDLHEELDLALTPYLEHSLINNIR